MIISRSHTPCTAQRLTHLGVLNWLSGSSAGPGSSVFKVRKDGQSLLPQPMAELSLTLPLALSPPTTRRRPSSPTPYLPSIANFSVTTPAHARVGSTIPLKGPATIIRPWFFPTRRRPRQPPASSPQKSSVASLLRQLSPHLDPILHPLRPARLGLEPSHHPPPHQSHSMI